jgi:GH24 family phage-related lysozyme (muramidase)
MNISNVGIKLIQDFEGCVLFEYKDAIGVPTIGWGHTGGVQPNQRITQAQADDLLRSDLKRFVDAVNNTGLKLNQNQFDALCSFAYNCGQSNLKTLVKDRSIAQIANALPMYCKASGRTLRWLSEA